MPVRHLVLSNPKYCRHRNLPPIPPRRSVNQHYGMTALPKFFRVGAAALLAIGFIWIPGRADTPAYEYPARSSPFCNCESENGPRASTCAPICQQQCQPESPDRSCRRILQNPKSLVPSNHLDQSRPAYSRKSNRTQRA
jgi:hypothetical protein